MFFCCGVIKCKARDSGVLLSFSPCAECLTVTEKGGKEEERKKIIETECESEKVAGGFVFTLFEIKSERRCETNQLGGAEHNPLCIISENSLNAPQRFSQNKTDRIEKTRRNIHNDKKLTI